MPFSRQLTFAPHGHILTNVAVWSPDCRRLVYDTRSDPAGDVFDGTTIETVDVEPGAVRQLYRSHHGACCGVATYHPTENRVVFILGPENPSPDWQYGPAHRQGVLVDETHPLTAHALDARDLVPPFTPGALRGGSHVHVYSGDGRYVSFTYEDHILSGFTEENEHQEINLRNVGVCMPLPVRVGTEHPRNHDGSCFSVLVTQTKAHPTPGSDEIRKACEEGWVGVNGYLKRDGSRQHRALAFQGQVLDRQGNSLSEVFIVDLPDDLTVAGAGPLQGTPTRRPRPPRGAGQRRLTFTAERKHPGSQGPRHWLRSSPDGARIAFLMRDDDGLAQLWTVSPNGGPPVQVTRNPWGIGSAFTWSRGGKYLAHIMDGSVCVTEAASGTTTRLTTPAVHGPAPRPEACVFSPDGRKLAYVQPVAMSEGIFNQIFVATVG